MDLKNKSILFVQGTGDAQKEKIENALKKKDIKASMFSAMSSNGKEGFIVICENDIKDTKKTIGTTGFYITAWETLCDLFSFYVADSRRTMISFNAETMNKTEIVEHIKPKQKYTNEFFVFSDGEQVFVLSYFFRVERSISASRERLAHRRWYEEWEKLATGFNTRPVLFEIGEES